ncbi:MAG: hypothetical protein HKN23_15690 [Verrucomicrobiales bacterium]|nr:hypothetical protein [Verrucomicrobiales bacterium]
MKQISVVAKRNQFLTAQITELLAERNINIESFDVEAVDDCSVVTLTTDNYDEALDALREAGLEAVSEDAIVIRVKDEPGSLAKIALRFKDEDIHLRSLRIMRRREGHALVAVSVDRTDRALELLDDLTLFDR